MVYKKIVEMTRNDVKKAFTKIYAADYCSLECLLKNQLRIGYNAGTFGWNYDVFSLNENVALRTGYRNMPGKEIPTNITSYYNKRAEEIFHNPILSYEEKNKNLSELIDQLVDELEEI